jgi:membrane-associated protease RseP (regulator of RpoE activity)
MFGSVQPTQFDLRFHLFGIPVTVTPWFWLAGILGGWQSSIGEHLDLLFIWIGCLFVSILVHELGHAFLAKSFGWPPEVFLYLFGGVAVYRPGYGHTTTRSVLISLAGPGAGFALYGLIRLLRELAVSSGWIHTLDPAWQLRLVDFFFQMEWINLWWGIVNLIPVLPLDGGRVAEALLLRARPWNGRRQAAMLSIVVSAAVAFYFFAINKNFGTFPAMLFAMLCITNVQSLQQHSPW